MIVSSKKISKFLGILLIFFTSFTIAAVDVTLKGGSEIKEGAEILKQATEIAAMLITLDTIKLFMVILLGFTIALKGVLIFSRGIAQFIIEENAFKKGILLSITGITFLTIGIVIIFKDELFNGSRKQANCNINRYSNVHR